METQGLSEEDAENVQNLQFLFEELDIGIVSRVYIQCNRETHAATIQLGELVQSPSKLSQLQHQMAGLGQHHMLQGGPSSLREGDEGLLSPQPPLPPSFGGGVLSREALLSSQEPSIASTSYASQHYQQQPQGQQQQPYEVPWQAFTIGETLTDVGTSFAEGVTLMAHNLTGWMADLVSAGWGDDEEEEEWDDAQRREQPSRGYGGSLDQALAERLHQRRGAGADVHYAPAIHEQEEYSEDGSEEEDEDEEDIKKDA